MTSYNDNDNDLPPLPFFRGLERDVNMEIYPAQFAATTRVRDQLNQNSELSIVELQTARRAINNLIHSGEHHNFTPNIFEQLLDQCVPIQTVLNSMNL